MMYISKMVPTSDKGRFYAFGRVFSGRVIIIYMTSDVFSKHFMMKNSQTCSEQIIP